MLKKITQVLVILVAVCATAIPAAHAQPPSRKAVAERFVDRKADSLNAYHALLRTDRFSTKTRFAYYLRWRDAQGRICKYLYEPQVVVHADGRVLAYNFGRNNERCYR